MLFIALLVPPCYTNCEDSSKYHGNIPKYSSMALTAYSVGSTRLRAVSRKWHTTAALSTQFISQLTLIPYCTMFIEF